jgi:hypothetical protein
VKEEGHLDVYDLLSGAYVLMKSLPGELIQIRTFLSDAYELAVKQDRPTDQIVALQRDLEAFEDLIREQTMDLIRKMAEVEAGSRG